MTDIDLQDDIEEARCELEPHVTRLKGLLQLWNIFTSAKMIADEFYKKHGSLTHPLLLACTKGLVVDYLKPWSGNQSRELKALRAYESKNKWSYPFLEAIVCKETHLQLEEVRHKMVAHIDHDFEGLGVTVKGTIIENKPTNRPQQDGTLDSVFLPVGVMLASNRGIWWLSEKDKIGEICNHINDTKKVVEEEIRASTLKFQDACMQHMHVIKELSDIFLTEKLSFNEGEINASSSGELPKPFYAKRPIETKIGDENIQSLGTCYEPRHGYPTNTEIEGKGYILKLENLTGDGKLKMNVVFPTYPAPKVKLQ